MSNRASSSWTWSDEQLADAVKATTNWRGVIHQLGLKSASAGATRIVRRRAEDLGLDTSHFRGARRWTDAQLRSAISGSRTWDEAITKLGLSVNSGNIRPFLKSHAIRLDIDYSHLVSGSPDASGRAEGPGYAGLTADQRHLREAAASMAATWFTLSGCAVSIPIEPAIYDLLAEMPDGIKRIQVKTTTYKGKDGWSATVGRRPYAPKDLGPLAPYDLGTIDYFFIIDGELNMYLLPAIALAGTVQVLLATYKHYIVGNANGLKTLECQSLQLRLSYG